MSLPAGNTIITNTSDILPSSSTTCLPGPQPSIFAIIGASAGGAAVLLALCLMILLILDRRRYRRQVSHFNKSVSFKTDSYKEKRTTPRDSYAVSQPSLLQPSTITRSFTSRHLRPPSDTPDDDDDLLLPPTITRTLSGRHLRAPADVPADLNSRCSTVSAESYYPSVYETETKVPPLAVIAPSLGPRGLPASPRDGYKGNISRSTSRATSRAPSRANSNRSTQASIT
jgi:hypothetical protein